MGSAEGVNRQILALSPPDIEVFAGWGPESGLTKRLAGRVPTVRWPNGRWCLEANLYLNSKLEQGHSINGRGGTLATYVYYLSPFIRSVFLREVHLIDVSDADFANDVKSLYGETRVGSGGQKSAYNRTTIRKMVSIWLDFLDFVGKLHGRDNFVGENGQIRATRVNIAFQTGHKEVQTSSWVHRSANQTDPPVSRRPILESTLKLLRRVAAMQPGLGFARLRRLTMIEVFGSIGLRRMEASQLSARVALDVVTFHLGDARKSGRTIRVQSSSPNLIFATVKGGNRRSVPVSPVTAELIDSYLARREALLRRLGIEPYLGDAPFFINIKTGGALTPDTFTTEFYTLKELAGIKVSCSPHLLRHRYIVRVFIRLALENDAQTKDEFRRRFIDKKSEIRRLRELTGHLSNEGVERYLEYAYDEITQLGARMTRVAILATFDALEGAVDRYKGAIESGDPVLAAEELIKAFEQAKAINHDHQE